MELQEKKQIQFLDESTFLRQCCTGLRNKIDFFLGSGASKTSGIPVGQEIVWLLKRDLYCSETHIKITDTQLYSEDIKKKIQAFFDEKGNYPKIGDPKEYAFYFKITYPDKDSQDTFIKDLMKDAQPSFGYIYLGAILLSNFTKNIWTTNFDNLVNNGINVLDSNNNFITYSINNIPDIEVLKKEDFPSVCKLHGDFRYEHTKNTLEDLSSLDSKMESCFRQVLCTKGLAVLGYSGSDDSIMKVLESGLDNEDFLSNGIYWLKRGDSELPQRVKDLLLKVVKNNKKAFVIDIEDFDSFFEHLYSQLRINNNKVESLKKEEVLSFYNTSYFFQDKDFKEVALTLSEFEKSFTNDFEETEFYSLPNICIKFINGNINYQKLLSILDKSFKKLDIEKKHFNLANYTNTMFVMNFSPKQKYILLIYGLDQMPDAFVLEIQKKLINLLFNNLNIRIVVLGKNASFIQDFEKIIKSKSYIINNSLNALSEKTDLLVNNNSATIIKSLSEMSFYNNINSNKQNIVAFIQSCINNHLYLDKITYENFCNISYRTNNSSSIILSEIEKSLIIIASYIVLQENLDISEKEMQQLINNSILFDFIIKSSIFDYFTKEHISFADPFIPYYFIANNLLQIPVIKAKKLLFIKSNIINEKYLPSIYLILKSFDKKNNLYTYILKKLKKHGSLYFLFINYSKLSNENRYNAYRSILRDFNSKNELIYYARFIQTHDLLKNIDSLSESMHKLLPEEFYDKAVKLHCDTINNFLQNPSMKDITTFENAVILLGVHDKFWKEKQYPLLKDVAVPLIRFFRENEISLKMKGLLSEDIILSWYEDYDWTINWEEKEWATFVKEIANITNTEFFNLKNENEFRIKLQLFNHFHSNFYIRRLLVPLTVKILENKNLRSGEASFVPNSLDDDFETPTIHFDNDISYFSYTIKNYEIPISDLLYILNSIDCNYVHHNYAYQLEELYRDLLKSFKEDISKIQDDEIPGLYTLFKKYINTDDGIFISDFNAYIKLLNDKHKELLFNLLFSDLKKNTNWQNLWMLHNFIVILLDIKNKDKAISLCKQLKEMDRVYRECIADIYLPNLTEHPIYELSTKEYPLLFPQTIKKDEEHKKILSQFDTMKNHMLEKEIEIITNKENLLCEVNNIFKYLDKTKEYSKRDTDSGRLLDLQVDYIGNKLQYGYKEEYKIPKIFSSFALTYLFNFTKDDQSLNRSQAIKNIEEWFSDVKFFWRYFFWLYICHYKKEETDDFLNKNPSLIERIKESMQQEVSYFSAENELSLYDGGRNRFWVVPFVHYLSRFYNNKLPEWFDKSKILNFIAYPAWQLSTGYGVHINGEFKWESWNSVFDWIRIVSDIDEDMIIEKSLSILSELKSDQSITQIVTVFVEKIKTNEKYKQQMLDVIINKTIEELQKDYKDHNEKSIMNGGALSSFWRETQEDLIDKLYPYVDFSKYNPDDINYCRRSVFEYICKNANENERSKIIESLKNRISEKIIRIYLTKLGYDKAIILTINEFLNGENFNTDYAFYSPLFGKTKVSLRLLSKYFQLYKYSLEKSNDRRNYLIGYAKEGILQTTTKKNFWFIKKNFKHLIKRLKKESRYFEGVEDFLNEIGQRIFDYN